MMTMQIFTNCGLLLLHVLHRDYLPCTDLRKLYKYRDPRNSSKKAFKMISENVSEILQIYLQLKIISNDVFLFFHI